MMTIMCGLKKAKCR